MELLPDEEEEEEEEEPDELPLRAAAIFASVLVPATPSGDRPLARWNFMTAASVSEP